MLRTERRYTKQTRDAVRRQNQELRPRSPEYIRAVVACAFVAIGILFVSTVYWRVTVVVAVVAAFLFGLWKLSRPSDA